MTNTIDRKSARAAKSAGRESAIGLQKHKRTPTDIGLALITPIVGQEFLDRYKLRDPLNRGLKYGVKQVFSVAGATNRQFKQVSGARSGPTRLKASGADYFDLTPDDDQKMIVETVNEFAEEVLRPAAREADESASYPADLVAKANELGITAINIPEDFDGIAEHRAAVTNALVAEALAYGDMGLALPILAPAGVASALTHWGSADQQATYLKDFAGENVPQACLAIAEPHPLFDPTALKTTAVRTPERVPPRRREVIGGRRQGRRIAHRGSAIERQARAVHRRVVVEGPDRHGRTEHGDPRRGPGPRRARPTSPCRCRRASARTPQPTQDYSQAVALSRLGWASLAVGTAHAVLDYVVPYVKERAGVRRADRPPPVGRVHVRQHRHRTRRSSTDHLARRLARRPGPVVRPRGRAGQEARHRQGHADRP